MPILAKAKKSEYTAAPEGLWAAVCCDVVDLGMVMNAQWGEKHMIKIMWQLEDVDPKSKKPYIVMRRFGLSLSEKSHLRPILESWRGNKFTQSELDGFDLEKLIGVNCQVQVIHNIKDNGDVFANVQAVVKPAKGAPKLRVRDYVRVADREQESQAPPIEEEDFSTF